MWPFKGPIEFKTPGPTRGSENTLNCITLVQRNSIKSENIQIYL